MVLRKPFFPKFMLEGMAFYFGKKNEFFENRLTHWNET